MPSSRPRIRLPLLLTALCVCGGAHAAQAAASAPPSPAAAARSHRAGSSAARSQVFALAQGSYTFDAASSEVDYKTHTGTFKQITISQGKVTVLADQAHATGLGAPSGQWTLEGHVRIHAPPRGSLTSNRAIVDITDNRIARVTVTGDPARFSQENPKTGRITQGHANQIVYDVGAGTVQLSENAFVAVGRDQFSSPTVLYNIVTERIQATSSGTGERVHITIAPRTAPPQGGGAPPAAPPRPAGRTP